jgi:hypothetical protein
MRAGQALAAGTLSVLLTACPPLGHDYEVVASSGGAGASGSSGAGGKSGAGGAGATAGAGAVAGSGGQATCEPASCAHTCCGTVCADLSSSPQHCGACDSPCPLGRSCNFGKCGPPGWVAVQKSANDPAARQKAAYVWTGKQLFVWGGVDASGSELADGGLYDPLDGTWTAIAISSNTPSPRVLATAVAIGEKILVWGGGDAASNADYKDGGIYDPATKSWTVVSAAPAEARAAIGVWSGAAQVLLWGGFDKSDKPIDNTFVYTPATDSWTSPSNASEPPALLHPTWAATSSELYVYGGRPNGLDKTDLAWRATLAAGNWSTLPKGPTARFGSFGAWDGARFFVWAGSDGGNLKDDGKLLEGAGWQNVGSAGARPGARWAPHRRSGWTAAIADGRFLVAGGTNALATSFHHDGGVYEHASASWKAVAAWTSAEDREWAAVAWTGLELVIWGGSTQGVPSSTGERYLPP